MHSISPPGIWHAGKPLWCQAPQDCKHCHCHTPAGWWVRRRRVRCSACWGAWPRWHQPCRWSWSDWHHSGERNAHYLTHHTYNVVILTCMRFTEVWETSLYKTQGKCQTHQDFNGSPRDLGGDTQSLEERGLLRTQTSVLGRHSHITRGDGSSTGSCRYLRYRVCNNLVQYFIISLKQGCLRHN